MKTVKLKNGARGKVFYGLHCYPGVAYYADDDAMIFISGNVLKKMDSTFAGCPVYVHHNDAPESLEETRRTADGWVVRSFYNVNDGKHWAQFVVVTDRGEKAIRKGWQLSNCYTPKKYGEAGVWNGIDYENEVLTAEYDHLAIVPNPRYAESVIYTPEEFEQYNQSHSDSISRLANSLKGTRPMAFSIFKRQKVEADKKLKNTVIQLERSGLEVRFEDLVKFADDQAMKHIKNSKKKKSNSDGDDDGDDQQVLKLKRKLKNAMDQIEELKELIQNSQSDDDDIDEDDDINVRNASDEDDDDDMENSDDEDMENEDDDDDEDDSKKKKSSKNSSKKNRKNSDFNEFLKGVKEQNKRKLNNAEKEFHKSQNSEGGESVIYDARARLQRGKELFG